MFSIIGWIAAGVVLGVFGCEYWHSHTERARMERKALAVMERMHREGRL